MGMNGRFTLEQCTRRLLDILDAPGESTLDRLSGNWETLLRLAADLRIYYYLASMMMEFWEDSLPEERKNEFKRGFTWNAARNVRLTGEIADLARRFRLAGIPAMFLKGAAGLARNLYPVELRYISDIDILIGRENAQEAGQLLKSMRYFNTPSNFYKTHHHLAPYYHNDLAGVVEVHFKPYLYYFNDVMSNVWLDSETIPCRNENITVPSITDHVWILLRKDILKNAYSARFCDLFEIAHIHDRGLMFDYSAILRRAADEKIPNLVHIPWYFLNRFFDIKGLPANANKNFEKLEKLGMRFQQKSLKQKAPFPLFQMLLGFVRFYTMDGFLNKISVLMRILKCHGSVSSIFQFFRPGLGRPALWRKKDNRMRSAKR